MMTHLFVPANFSKMNELSNFASFFFYFSSSKGQNTLND